MTLSGGQYEEDGKRVLHMGRVHFRVAKLNQLHPAKSRSEGGKLRTFQQENVLTRSTQELEQGLSH